MRGCCEKKVCARPEASFFHVCAAAVQSILSKFSALATINKPVLGVLESGFDRLDQ